MTNAAGSSSALQNRFRTHYCGSLGPVLQQEKVSLAGGYTGSGTMAAWFSSISGIIPESASW